MASLKNNESKKKKTKNSRYNQVEILHHHKMWIGNSEVREKYT